MKSKTTATQSPQKSSNEAGLERSPDIKQASQIASSYSPILSLQRTVGNHAVNHLIQSESTSSTSVPRATSPHSVQTSEVGQPLPFTQRQWLERSTGTLPPIAIDQSQAAQQSLTAENAYAAAKGSRIIAEPNALSGEGGKARLAHEVAHILQQQSSALPTATSEQAEADANRFAQSVVAGVPARVSVSSPIRWAYDKKRAPQRVPPEDKVKRIVIIGGKATGKKKQSTAFVYIQKRDSSEYKLTYSVSHNLPVRDTPYTLENGSEIPELPSNKKAWFSFSGGPTLSQENFPPTVPLLVQGAGTSVSDVTSIGGKEATGKDNGGKDGKGNDKTVTDQKGSGSGSSTTPKSENVATGGATGKASGATALPETAKVPIVTITDIKQIEELKKKGLIPVDTADKIKSKLDRQETLTFEEAVALVDALNQVVSGRSQSETQEEKEAHESWLKWAKFIQENKDKISGRVSAESQAGDKSITVDEVKDILKKHKEFVGIEDKPAVTSKTAAYDPERRKSWNSLNPWEKTLWNEYLTKYGDTADVTDSSSKDLRITEDVRFSMALRMSPQYMKPGAREAAQQLFNDPIFLHGTLAGIAAYLALWALPEPVFTKAAAVLTTIGLMSLVAFSVSEIKNLAFAWLQLQDESKQATTLPELEKAAENFGKSVAGSGLRILVALATVVAGKALPAPKPLPPPSGGGGLVGATAGGSVVMPRATAVPQVKVLPDGSIVISGPMSGVAMSASKGSGGGSSGSNKDVTESKPEVTSEEPQASKSKPQDEASSSKAAEAEQQPSKVTTNPAEAKLFKDRTPAEVAEMKRYMEKWDKSSYSNVEENILDHAQRKGFDPLRYLRKANNFNTKGATRIPKSGYREDGSAIYKKGNEFMVVRPDQYGGEKIVTYGVNQ